MPEMVPAYDKRTGKKLLHLVPRHFLEPGSPFPNLSATPRSKATSKATTSDPTSTDNKSGSNAAGGKAGAPTTKEK